NKYCHKAVAQIVDQKRNQWLEAIPSNDPNGNWINYRFRHSGKLHGPYKEWNREGWLYIESNYENGQLHGTYLIYNSNGEVIVNHNYANGMRHGDCIEYNSVNEMTISQYKDGV